MTERITAWSFSRYNTYKQCPFKAKLLYVEKLKEPGSPALENGVAKHTDLEHFLKGYAELPSWMHKKLVDYCNKLKADKAQAELSVAFNDQWQPVEWFSKDAWARIKIDAFHSDGQHIRVVDWKTGRIRDGEYDEQLELYALTGFLMLPKAETASTELAFVEHGVVLPCEPWKAEDKDMLLARWNQRVGVMLEDTEFKATPNQYCKWCSFSKTKGGPCGAA